MDDLVLHVRLTGKTQDAVEKATVMLASAIAEQTKPVSLEMRASRLGRRGEWVVYGRLIMVDA